MAWNVRQSNGIHLPQIGWRLDARKPVDKAFVSHAHFDHMGDHAEILCTPATAALVEKRIRGSRKWTVKEFGERFEIEPGVEACLHPAGHIPGSAMLYLNSSHGSLLYTGDFKLSEGSSAESCRAVSADTLIIETTYGIPRYTLPPQSEIAADIARFCRETLENGDTPVLFGYSLGKSQTILRILSDSGLEVMLHPKSLELTRACQDIGWKFPPYQAFSDNSHRGKVLISPPQARGSSWLKRIHNPKTAIISGWAIDPAATYRYQCDKAFALSDHADYLDLQSFVAQCRPQRVYTVHGFAREFANTLREQGYEAYALGKENQLDLEIPKSNPQPSPAAAASAAPPALETSQDASPCAADSFKAFSRFYQSLQATDSNAKKAEAADRYFKSLDDNAILQAVTLLSGESWSDRQSENHATTRDTVHQAVLTVSQARQADYTAAKRASGERYATYAKLLPDPANPTIERSLDYICSFAANLVTAAPSFQFSLLSEQLRSLSRPEQLLLLRLIENTIASEPTLRAVESALAKRFSLAAETVQRAHLRGSSLTRVARQLIESGDLTDIAASPFTPIPFEKTERAECQEELFERLGPRTWIEDKFDGLRCQVHKVAERAELYDFRQGRITHQFPELAAAVRHIPQDFIVEAEIVAWEDERPLPRASLQVRLARSGEDLFLGEETGVILWLFDILWMNGKDLLDLPLESRRKQLDSLTVNDQARISAVSRLDNPLQIENSLDAAKRRGNQGIVCKDPDSPYQMGLKSDQWLTFEGTDLPKHASKP